MSRKTLITITLILSAALNLLAPSPVSSSASGGQERQRDDSRSALIRELGVEVQYFEDGKVKCRQATADEARMMTRRDPNLQLREITPTSSNQMNAQSGGLKIILRGTSQLEAFPQAKEAFLKAAAVWESIIQNPITIVVDVDFGPTIFGEPFPANFGGLTNFQNIGPDEVSEASFWYPTIRDKLIASASNDEERSLYNSLPVASVPTDFGNTAAVFGPATLFRALGLLDPVADPDQEGHLGTPPSIGFNSARSFDFDQSDGIDSDKQDFTALAEHEIGHVLGFFSLVGVLEIFNAELAVSVWDLFRFRPGITFGTFSFASRILSSGDVHVFFAGRSEVELSTGRIDSSGGNGFQSHHWKPFPQTGHYIGVMDPTLSKGQHAPITENDIDAIDAMGYRVTRNDGGGAPVINDLAASLDGDVLSLTGTASDADGDMTQAQVKLLNGGGLVVAQTSAFPVDFGNSTESDFQLAITNLSQFPTAVEALLTLIDSQGNNSEGFSSRFNQSAPGGPVLSSVSLNGKKLRIKGNGLSGSIEIEINGIIVADGPNLSGKKVILKGTPSSLNLRSGPNRVRVCKSTLWSNIFIVDMS